MEHTIYHSPSPGTSSSAFNPASHSYLSVPYASALYLLVSTPQSSYEAYAFTGSTTGYTASYDTAADNRRIMRLESKMSLGRT
jgi:hypothetical protein